MRCTERWSLGLMKLSLYGDTHFVVVVYMWDLPARVKAWVYMKPQREGLEEVRNTPQSIR